MLIRTRTHAPLMMTYLLLIAERERRENGCDHYRGVCRSRWHSATFDLRTRRGRRRRRRRHGATRATDKSRRPRPAASNGMTNVEASRRRRRGRIVIERPTRRARARDCGQVG